MLQTKENCITFMGLARKAEFKPGRKITAFSCFMKSWNNIIVLTPPTYIHWIFLVLAHNSIQPL